VDSTIIRIQAAAVVPVSSGDDLKAIPTICITLCNNNLFMKQPCKQLLEESTVAPEGKRQHNLKRLTTLS
jgi:hypothetical protein